MKTQIKTKTSLLLAIVFALACCVTTTFAMIGMTAKAVDGDIDVTDIIEIASGGVTGENNTYLEIKFGTYSLAPADTSQGTAYYPNDHAEVNGVDWMEYIFVNGRSSREIVEENKANSGTEKEYKGASSPMSLGWCYAPVLAYVNGSAISLQIMTAYVPYEQLEVALKPGFRWTNTAGQVLTTTQEIAYKFIVNYGWKNKYYHLSFTGADEEVSPIRVGHGDAIANLPPVPERAGYTGVWKIGDTVISPYTVWPHVGDNVATAHYVETVDVTESVTMASGGVTGDNNSYIEIKFAPYSLAPAVGERDVTAGAAFYPNDHAAVNNLDLMEYIFISGRSSREIIEENKANSGTDKEYKGTYGPMTNGWCYAPVLVYVSGSTVSLQIMTAFTPYEGLEIAFKPGFIWANTNGETLTTTKEIAYKVVGGVLINKYYELSFEGVDDSIRVCYGEAVGALPAVPEKEGYENGVWKIGETELSASTVWQFTENKTATAVYTPKQYTLSFSNDEEVISPITVTYDAAIGTLPAITERSGYIGVWKIDGDVITEDTVWKYTESKTASADYELLEFVLSFSNGSETIAPIDVTYGEPVTGLPAITERVGYTGKWQIDGTDIAEGFIWNYVVNKTAVAVYTANTYTLSFSNGSETISPVTVTYDEAIGTLPAITARAGYVGVWKIGETVITEDTVWNYTEAKTATAHYAAIEYTVTFDGENEIKVAYGEKISEPATPTKEPTVETEFEFDGWYLGEKKWDFAADVVEGDMNLVAKFNEVARKYTITFNVKGYKGFTLESVRVAYGSTFDLSNILDGKDTSGYTYTISVGGVEKLAILVEGDVTVDVTFTKVSGGKTGCGGSLSADTSVLFALAALGVALIGVAALKRKQEDK